MQIVDYGIVIKYINQEVALLTLWKNFAVSSFLEEQIRKLKCDLCAIFMHNNYGRFTTFYPLELCIWKLFHCNRKLDR